MDNAEIRLLSNVPLFNKYINTLNWGTQSAQENYFNSKQIKAVYSASYQRKDNIIRVEGKFDDLITVNYVMYQNSQSAKWYYAFVTDIQYVADETTWLTIETDVIQTWYFEMNIHTSFVEREHVSDDTIGAHTVPENLDVGEYTTIKDYRKEWYTDDTRISVNGGLGTAYGVGYWIVLASTIEPFNLKDIYFSYRGSMDMISGLQYYCAPYSIDGLSQLSDVIKDINDAGKIDGIRSIYMVPDFLITGKKIESAPPDSLIKIALPRSDANIRIQTIMSTTLADNYIPRNNKLYCHPYNILYGTNNQGQYNVYKFEDFTDSTIWFKVLFDITETSKPIIQPIDYRNSDVMLDDGLSLPSYVQGSWSSDQYTAWWAQNGAQFAVNVATGIAGVVLAPATAGLSLGLTASSLGTISSQLMSANQAEIAPPSVHGNSGGTTLQSIGANWFTFFQRSAKKEYLEIIDNYFDMFGYKINKIKIPNIRTRPQWNFVKTVSINITGNIPPKDLLHICDIFNNGTTFWRNPDNVGNYNLNNH